MQNKKWNNFYIMSFCQNSIVKELRVAKHVHSKRLRQSCDTADTACNVQLRERGRVCNAKEVGTDTYDDRKNKGHYPVLILPRHKKKLLKNIINRRRIKSGITFT